MPPHVNVAFVYNARGENDKAEASFRRAIALEPNNPVVHLNLGMLSGRDEAPGPGGAGLSQDPCARSQFGGRRLQPGRDAGLGSARSNRCAGAKGPSSCGPKRGSTATRMPSTCVQRRRDGGGDDGPARTWSVGTCPAAKPMHCWARSTSKGEKWTKLPRVYRSAWAMGV